MFMSQQNEMGGVLRPLIFCLEITIKRVKGILEIKEDKKFFLTHKNVLILKLSEGVVYENSRMPMNNATWLMLKGEFQ